MKYKPSPKEINANLQMLYQFKNLYHVSFIENDATTYESDIKFDFIYSNHLLEHISIFDNIKIFEKSYINLKKG